MNDCKKLLFFVLFASLCFRAISQSNDTSKDSIVIRNSLVARTFYFDKNKPGFYTVACRNLVSNENYVRPGTEEFAIKADTQTITGLNCKYQEHQLVRTGDTQTLTVRLGTPIKDVFIQLIYILYDDLPVIRKRIEVINQSKREIALTDLDVERLQFQVVDTYMNEVYANYGTHLTRIPYKGDYNDAAVLLFNLNAKQGVVFGNEAPSVLKRTEIYQQPNRIAMGMGLSNEPFPFKKWLQPAETFISPQVFMCFSNSDKWQYAFEGKFQDFIRKKLGVQLFRQKQTPFFIYNTWQPFFDNINENIIKESANHLSSTGCDLFIIDAGWYKRAGDFKPDPAKFPNGLKPVCDYIRSKGMKAGLWFTIGSVHAQSKVALEHPEWLIKNKEGKPENLHDGNTADNGDNWNSAIRTMSLASGYYNYVHNIIRGYVKDCNLSYLKLDLSVANSAYVDDYNRTGDYDANGGKLYKDRVSSYWSIYERVLSLFDTLKHEFPNLLVDCTFEVWGRYNLVDYALIEHADYDWLTNFDFAPPTGPISIRQMNYDRSRAIPANTLLIGNQFMNFPNYAYVYFSMASASTLMVGDPRKLSTSDKAFYAKWNGWFKAMESKYQFSQYRQTYDIFDRPTDENWDGCYRFNTEKEGGVLFFYRNNSGDEKRTFKLPYVNPNSTYKIYSPFDNQTIQTCKGSELITKGITVQIDSIYTAKVLGIEKE